MAVSATVLLSGGIDSTVCMSLLQRDGYSLFPTFIDFRQSAAAWERQSAQSVAGHFGCDLTTIDVRGPRLFDRGEIRGRNAFLISTALMISSNKSGLLVIGIHAGTSYYDCSKRFFDLMASLVAETSAGNISLVAPLLNWTKREALSYFEESGIDASKTYSCEVGGAKGCGKCLSCLDRKSIDAR